MARLTPDQLDEIRQANPIADVIQASGVELRKRGKHLWACCPFHDEDTPSFAVDVVKSRFKCYGCGADGDVISFVMKRQSVDFRAAVQRLIDQAGLKLEQGPPPKRQADRDRIMACLAWSVTYFQGLLKNDPTAKDFARSRGLWTKYALGWGLGFGPADRYPLIRDARDAGFSRSTLMAAGLIGESENKGKTFTYNRFTNRLVFPICDPAGQVRGFAGRHLDPGNPRKYINSAEGEVFQKARLLYGAERLKHSKRLKAVGYVAIAEGYTDVIRLHWLGFDNVVAPMGTSITSDQVNLIGRYTKKVVLVLDGDSAGIQAAIKSIPLFLNQGIVPYVVVVPDGLDPDEYIGGFLVGAGEARDQINRASKAVSALFDTKIGALDFALRARLGAWGKWDGDEGWSDVIHQAPAEMLRGFYDATAGILNRDDMKPEAKALFQKLREMAGLQLDRRDREVQAIRTDVGNTWEDRQMMLIFRTLAPYERDRLLRAGARLVVNQERHAKELGYPKPRQPWPDPTAVRRGGPIPGERRK